MVKPSRWARSALGALAVFMSASLLMGADSMESSSGNSDPSVGTSAKSASGALTWSLQLEQGVDPKKAPAYKKTITDILNNPDGWAQLGRGFKYVADPNEANYPIVVGTGTRLKQTCHLSTDDPEQEAACSFPRSHPPAPCVVILDKTIFDGRLSKEEHLPLDTIMVNHALGHCFGLQHTDDSVDLMSPSNMSTPYPSAAEVKAAKKHLP